MEVRKIGAGGTGRDRMHLNPPRPKIHAKLAAKAFNKKKKLGFHLLGCSFGMFICWDVVSFVGLGKTM